jgi:hypothetical protein
MVRVRKPPIRDRRRSMWEAEGVREYFQPATGAQLMVGNVDEAVVRELKKRAARRNHSALPGYVGAGGVFGHYGCGVIAKVQQRCRRRGPANCRVDRA